ncbi:MAG: hypothetical protein ABIK89_14520, partial [Planctomycetota bacterium]
HLYTLAVMLSDDVYTGANPLSVPDAQRLAQWAVNVVDFRDRDSIMTRFQYDRNPLNGWTPNNAADNPNAPNNVVWGCERPELLISETTAIHDRRTQDLTTDPSGEDSTSTPPDDFDSRVHPQGSLFVELYNPQTAQEHLPGEFCYDRLNNTFNVGVRLNQTTPQGDPVWRMLIAQAAGQPDTDPNFEVTRNDPDDDDPALLPTVERSAYFVQPAGAYGDGAAVQYYPSDQVNMAPVMPGRYAVIGPGDAFTAGVTYFGFQQQDLNWDASPAAELPRRIALTQNVNPNVQQVSVYSSAINQPDVTGPPVIPALSAVAVIMNSVATPPVGNRTVPRFSISEPTNGYPDVDPNGNAMNNTGTPNREFLIPYDVPLDQSQDPALWNDGTGKGIGYEGLSRRFRVIYLQRLANPLAPWDATFNPYRTVDTMQVDLTAFNGMVADANDQLIGDGYEEFFTYQRGYNAENQAAAAQNVWAGEPETEEDPLNLAPPHVNDLHPPPPLPITPAHWHNERFAHTLGRLNEWFGPPRGPDANDPGNLYLGDPANGPFPWLTWLNRPFVNRMELLLVPDKRSSQLLRNFTIGQEGNNPYVLAQDPPGRTGDLSFQHLRPFFGTPPAFGGGPPNPPSRLYRVLDFVHVPSRFVGTEVQGNPGVFQGDPLVVSAQWPGPSLPFPFRPPFNGISLCREPGRMNMNTIFSQGVWNGLSNYFRETSGTYDYWNLVRESRQGYMGPLMALDPRYPTRFANPFRSFAGASLVPIPDPVVAASLPLPPPPFPPPLRGEIHGTLLRKWQPSALDSGGDAPLFRHQSGDVVQQTARNPYFRYQLLERLGGLTTTRSNVYGVWITLGFFEVEEAPNPGWFPVQYLAVYPSGYRLGQELGSDTGEIKRHRAFYLFDRSIPVGFERGRDVNVKKAILLERFIE